MQQFMDEVLMRSTGILCTQEPATTILNTFPYGISSDDTDYLAGPHWSHTHTIDISRDEIYLKIGEEAPFMIESVTIMGQLQWRKRKRSPQFFILENIRDQSIFAGAAISIGIHQFQIAEKHKNIIRKLKIK